VSRVTDRIYSQGSQDEREIQNVDCRILNTPAHANFFYVNTIELTRPPHVQLSAVGVGNHISVENLLARYVGQIGAHRQLETHAMLSPLAEGGRAPISLV